MVEYKMVYRRRTAGPKRSAVRRAGMKKAMAKRRAGGAARYRSKLQRVYTQAGAITHSLWRYGRSRVPKQVLAMRRVGAPDVYQANGGYLCASSTGYQAYYDWQNLNQDHLEAILSIAGNQSAPNRVLIENVQSELTLTNITNAAAEVEIYDITFKRDVPVALNYTLGSTNYTIDGHKVADYINQGVAMGASLPSSYKGSQFIGSSPFDSQIFKDYCRVVKRTHVMLPSGASHRHTSQIKVNRVCDLAINSSTMACVRGFTTATLINVRGVAAYVQSGDNATLGTPSDITINAYYGLRVKYTYVQDVNSSLAFNDVLEHTAPTSIRNIGNGAIEVISP